MKELEPNSTEYEKVLEIVGHNKHEIINELNIIEINKIENIYKLFNYRKNKYNIMLLNQAIEIKE